MKRKLFAGVTALFLIFSCLLLTVGGEAAGEIFDEDFKGVGSEATEIQDWHELNEIRDDLSSDYVLVEDLDEDTDGYEDYNAQREDHEVVYFAGPDEDWEDGDTIEIPYGEDEYDSVLSVEDEDGNLISHTVDHPTITIDEDVGENYLGVNFENAVVGWEPIGNNESPFNGTFDGNGHEISDLNIKRGGTSGIGIFGFTSEEVEIKDIGLVDVDVKGLGYVGGLVGYNKGTISDSHVTGEVSGVSSIGGLVGLSQEGDVKTSYATSDVSGMGGTVGGLVGLSHSIHESYATGDVSGSGAVGGLVGLTRGTISRSFATGDVNGEEKVGGLVGHNAGGPDAYIEQSFATGEVNGEEFVGGLVGHNKDDIEDSYATGDVNGGEIVGGLVGLNSAGPGLGSPDMPFPSTVKTSYATGEVTGEENVGGLVGLTESGNVTYSYWDIETSEIEESDGGTGLTTEEMTGAEAEDNMEGFDFEEIWETVEKNDEDAVKDSYPILQELDREEQLKAQNVYGEDDVIPGFASTLLLMAVFVALAVYHKKL